jgi:hypothetical protein
VSEVETTFFMVDFAVWRDERQVRKDYMRCKGHGPSTRHNEERCGSLRVTKGVKALQWSHDHRAWNP